MGLQYKDVLLKYFPEETVEQVSSWLIKHSIQLKITRNRVSKLGDYRPPQKLTKHRISINGNLEKYFVYLIFLHELAHLLVWNKYANKVQPHGKQWKEEFGSLLRQAIFLEKIPDFLIKPVHNFSLNVKATFASDQVLWKLLKGMDQQHEDETTIEDIAIDSYFMASNGRIFKKENKLRKRYRCFCVSNKRRYLFHPMAVIKPLSIKENS
jgi:SprT protein